MDLTMNNSAAVYCAPWALIDNVGKIHNVVTTVFVTSVINGLFILPVLILNGIILIAIIKTPSLRNPSNLLLSNLMFTDFLMGLIGQPLYIVTKVWSVQGVLYRHCSMGTAERIFANILPLSLMLTLSVSSLDRYLAIHLMLQYRTRITSFRAILIIIILWASAVLCVLSILVLGQEGFVIFLGVVFTVCMLVTFVAYFKAFRGLRRHQTQVTSSENVVSTVCINVKKYHRSFTTMLCVFLLQLLFYTPDICVKLISVNHTTKSSLIANMVSDMIMYANAVMNPLVFLWRMRDIRRVCKNFYKKIFKK